jgi:hypothetical protein
MNFSPVVVLRDGFGRHIWNIPLSVAPELFKVSWSQPSRRRRRRCAHRARHAFEVIRG